MRKASVSIVSLLLFLMCHMLAAQDLGLTVVVLNEPGFPSADSVAPSAQQLGVLFQGARMAAADQLGEALGLASTRVLVLPYGSAFPENDWQAIKSYLDRGGNLVVLGGRPFRRATFHDGTGWHLRDYSVRFTRPLMIDQYQETPGSEELQFER